MGINGNLKYVFLHAIDPDKLYINNGQPTLICEKSRRGRNRMVVGFTTICAINAYHH
jgi:hypothetical protein